MYKNHSTADPEEIAKFNTYAHEWWQPNGKFKVLHAINPLRIEYITQHICEKSKILDIGCGGGLVAEPLAVLNHHVIGIDASEKNIYIAREHAIQNNVLVQYVCTTVENFTAEQPFDVIIASEVIEHVDNLTLFIEACSKLLSANGQIIISTLNRTVHSFIFAILGAEYLLKWLPRGTHDWHKFLTPAELGQHLRQQNIVITSLNGLSYSVLANHWSITNDITINYFAIGCKR